MRSIHMMLTTTPPLHWVVRDDAGNEESFGSAVDAMSHAKARFHELDPLDMAVLWVSLGDTRHSALMIRDHGNRPRAAPAPRVTAHAA